MSDNRNFRNLLKARWAEGKFVCVGLDSDAGKVEQLSRKVRFSSSDADLHHKVMGFNQAIIDSTSDLVCAYKLNSAFYEALGEGGLLAIAVTINWIRQVAPGVPIILDYKRGDIGNTNNGYVAAAKAADAVTVHPYLGVEAMTPFLDNPNKGVIVLCKTSNPGAGEFQDARCFTVRYRKNDRIYSTPQEMQRELGLESFTSSDFETVEIPLYQLVAHRVAQVWNYNGNCAMVVGATYPAELADVREIVGDMPILIPGIGAQGGELEATVRAGANSKGQGMIINSSRGIIFASDGPDFAEAARAATQNMHRDITAVLATA